MNRSRNAEKNDVVPMVRPLPASRSSSCERQVDEIAYTGEKHEKGDGL